VHMDGEGDHVHLLVGHRSARRRGTHRHGIVR
jgi:hypothetical protein